MRSRPYLLSFNFPAFGSALFYVVLESSGESALISPARAIIRAWGQITPLGAAAASCPLRCWMAHTHIGRGEDFLDIPASTERTRDFRVLFLRAKEDFADLSTVLTFEFVYGHL